MFFIAPIEWFVWIIFIAVMGIIFIAFPVPTLIVVGLVIWAVVSVRRNSRRYAEEQYREGERDV